MFEKQTPVPPAMQSAQIAFGPDDHFLVASIDLKTRKVNLAWGQRMTPLDLMDLAVYIFQAMFAILKGAIVSPIADSTGKPFIHGLDGGGAKEPKKD